MIKLTITYENYYYIISSFHFIFLSFRLSLEREKLHRIRLIDVRSLVMRSSLSLSLSGLQVSSFAFHVCFSFFFFCVAVAAAAFFVWLGGSVGLAQFFWFCSALAELGLYRYCYRSRAQTIGRSSRPCVRVYVRLRFLCWYAPKKNNKKKRNKQILIRHIVTRRESVRVYARARSFGVSATVRLCVAFCTQNNIQ